MPTGHRALLALIARLPGAAVLPVSPPQVLLYRHEKTGAQLMNVINSDENKTFGVTFRYGCASWLRMQAGMPLGALPWAGAPGDQLCRHTGMLQVAGCTGELPWVGFHDPTRAASLPSGWPRRAWAGLA